ncbi:MAG: RNA polymerase Rpb4 family protein [Thermoplasmatota archaeon]
MAAEEEQERMLTHEEVKKLLESAMDKPSVIYTGPEDDGFGPRKHQVEMEEGEETEEDIQEIQSFEKRSTMEHVSSFMRIDQKKAQKMIEELQKLERITETHSFKIAELMPRDEQELRPVFAKDRFTLTPEELKQILDIIDSHRI